MERSRIRLEKAISALPDLEELRMLREVLVGASSPDEPHVLGSASRLATVDRRTADLARVEAGITGLAERVRDRTERVLSSAVAALRALEAGDETEAAIALVSAGEVEEAHDRLGEAEEYYRKALEMGRRPRDRGGEALALRRLGRVARRQGRYERSLALYARSVEVSEHLRDAGGVVVGLLGAGHALADQGRWAEARDHYLRAVDRVEDRATPEFVHLCNGLSVVERRMGNLEASGEWLERGEAELPRISDQSAAAYLEHGRAKLHLAAGEPAAAEAVFRSTLERPLSSPERVAVLINLAEALLEAGRTSEAEAAVRDAERDALARGDLTPLPHVYTVLGRIAGIRRDADGFVFFEQALEVIRERSLPELDHATVQHEYGKFEAELGHDESAAARLRIAADTFRALGSKADAESAEHEMRRIRGASQNQTEVEDGKR